ncbi:MAG: type II toxin-antitoxin system RelE/ParE family toxin [Thermomicrobiales bacterium]
MGEGFTIEFFAAASSEEPVRAFLLALSAKARQKCITSIDLLGMKGFALHASHIKKREGDIWELRPEFGGSEYRIFFGRQGETLVLLHAITKKRQKVARGDIVLAQRRLNEWRERRERKDEL